MPDFEGKVNITKDGQVTIMLDGDAGKVGVGTTSPEGKLHVQLQESSTEQVLVKRPYLNDSAILRLHEGSPIIQMDDRANGSYIRGNIWTAELQDAGSLQLGRVADPQATNLTLIPGLHVSGNGKVGIGTIRPQALLHVLDLGQSRGQRDTMPQAIESPVRQWPARGLWSRVHHLPGTPARPSDQRQTV